MNDSELRQQLISQIASVYARRHNANWKSIQDVTPNELVKIILDDSAAIVDEIILPFAASRV